MISFNLKLICAIGSPSQWYCVSYVRFIHIPRNKQKNTPFRKFQIKIALI